MNNKTCFRTKDIKGIKSGYLTAVKISHHEQGKGWFWVCKCCCDSCKGKGTRTVLARNFIAGKVLRCEAGINPNRKRCQQQNITKSGTWYVKKIRTTWKQKIDAFTPVQRMIFLVILDGRNHWHLQMQTVDIVLRMERPEQELDAMVSENPKRFQRYLQRQLEVSTDHAFTPHK